MAPKKPPKGMISVPRKKDTYQGRHRRQASNTHGMSQAAKDQKRQDQN